MGKSLLEPSLHRLIDQFNDRKLSHKEFCTIFLDNIHPFWDGNGRTYKILFADQINSIWTNDFSALDTRLSADEKEPNSFQIRLISWKQCILNENIFCKSECILFWSRDKVYCFAWHTPSCYQFSFRTEQTVLLTMETSLQTGETRANIYTENKTKSRFIKWSVFTK